MSTPPLVSPLFVAFSCRVCGGYRASLLSLFSFLFVLISLSHLSVWVLQSFSSLFAQIHAELGRIREELEAAKSALAAGHKRGVSANEYMGLVTFYQTSFNKFFQHMVKGFRLQCRHPGKPGFSLMWCAPWMLHHVQQSAPTGFFQTWRRLVTKIKW